MIVISGVLTVDTVPSTPVVCPTGVWRSLNPMDPMPPVSPVPLVEWEFLNLTAKSPTSVLRHPQAGIQNPPGALGVYPDDLWLTEGSNVLWALDKTFDTTIWMWEDTLATPVIQLTPTDGAAVPSPVGVTLTWEKLDGASKYEVLIYSYCPACPTQKSLEYTITTPETCLIVGPPDSPLEPGTTYYWKVRVFFDSPEWSKWSELWTFKTSINATEFCSPVCGEEDISLTPNFSWLAVPGATGYEIEVATDELFSTIIAEGTPTINAWDGVPELEYGTTYYWRVRAVKDGVTSVWTNCLFSTMDEPIVPTTTTTTLEVTQEEITPMWIWVIIGIGAALVIAVIVLIVTTRRTA